MEFYQQGDVLLEIVNEINGKEFENESGEIAKGEATGHSHKFENSQNVRYFRNEQQELFLELLQPTKLLHQEHNPQIISKGKYRMKIVREYDHFSEEIRNIQD